MTTRVAIHQPNYLPYLGFFHKLSLVDTFVLYDTAQFSKNDFHNRNRIKTPSGTAWLTVPVSRPALRPIREVRISAATSWADRHLKSIEANYSRAAYFVSYRDELRIVFKKSWLFLAELNESLIRMLAKAWDFPVRFVRASECLGVTEEASRSSRLVELVRAVGGDEYVSGPGGLDYVDPTVFGGVGLRLQVFRHAEYRQLWGPFLPSMSAIDLLLNEGDRGRETIIRSGEVRPWPASRLT